MKPAILYAAKSTEDVRGSIPDQLADTRKLAGERGLEVVDEFKDEAASAFHGNRGEGLAKAMVACERLSAERDECWLLIQHSSRLARGDAMQARHLVEITLWAMKHRITIASVHDPGMFPDDPEDPVALLLSSVAGTPNHQESARKSKAVSKGMRRRAERGGWVGGHPPYGYRHRDRHAESGKPTGPLVVVPAQAEVVRRIFKDYAAGVAQRALVRALNAEGIRSAEGKQWLQSAITRILTNPAYAGKLPVTGEDGKPLPGAHEAIVDEELWSRVQAIGSGATRRKGGRHADGAHLLVRGVLRCGSCGSAMLPRKARPGVERERYVCSGRIEHGRDYCAQPSIRRELIDEPLLATLLDGYIDHEATVRRIEERASAELTVAREALGQAEREAAAVDYDRRLARATRGWQDEVIDDAEYARQRAELDNERDGAQAALAQAQERTKQIEQGAPGDAEQILLDHLATIKRAVTTGIDEARDLHALRNVIGQMFESIRLVRSGRLPLGDLGPGFIPFDEGVPLVEDGQERYWLLLMVCSSLVDRETFKPIGQATPVPAWQSYPPTFLARYCW
jgi:site-specific DNA recombinase